MLDEGVHVKPLISIIGSLHCEKADAETRAHGVKHLDAPLGIFIAQLLGRKPSGIERSADAGGDAYIDNVAAL